MPEPYGPDLALETLRNILLNDGRLIIRYHCYIRMDERTIDDLDIKKVLLDNGTINSKPKFDEKHQKYKYRVDGVDTEGERVSIVVNIIEGDWTVVAITAIAK